MIILGEGIKSRFHDSVFHAPAGDRARWWDGEREARSSAGEGQIQYPRHALHSPGHRFQLLPPGADGKKNRGLTNIKA